MHHLEEVTGFFLLSCRAYMLILVEYKLKQEIFNDPFFSWRRQDDNELKTDLWWLKTMMKCMFRCQDETKQDENEMSESGVSLLAVAIVYLQCGQHLQSLSDLQKWMNFFPEWCILSKPGDADLNWQWAVCNALFLSQLISKRSIIASVGESGTDIIFSFHRLKLDHNLRIRMTKMWIKLYAFLSQD